MDAHRELLELAAKACGEWSDKESLEPFEHVIDRWNPKDDSGDGARMEEALGLTVRWGVSIVSVLRPDGGWNDENYGDHNNDRGAARRLASLRAAAEIGRGMAK